jgi:GDPmannose 4,6-dehydratase
VTASRRALVVGSRGQDGRLLCRLLASRGYDWVGVARNATDDGGIGWSRVVDVTDAEQVDHLVAAVRPDEVYHLAAFHGSAESDGGSEGALRDSLEVNVLSLGFLLEAIRRRASAARLFYAASSHVFGEPEVAPQDEETPLRPSTTYGVTKAAGLMLCRAYRAQHGVFAAAGILYNHESGLRAPEFVSSRIVDAALAIRKGGVSPLTLARLAASADWGYAPEYVEAMHRILQLERPDDFVVATGRSHSVAEFAAAAFAAVGLDWRDHVREDAARPVRSHRGLVGDPRRLEAATGWRARVVLPELASVLVREREARGAA